MCCKDKCFYIIPVEKGCFALAILNAVASGLIFVASVIVGILIAVGVMIFHDEPQRRSGDVMAIFAETGLFMVEFAVGVAVIIAALGSVTAFVFSVMLCNGISNRRPAYVKAYFFYGVVATVLAAAGSVVLLVIKEELYGILGLFGCVVYSLFLLLVHRTYTKLSDDEELKDHIGLVENNA